MIRRERKFYSEEFRERVLTAYYNSNESVDMIARRFQVKRDTVSSWVHRKRVAMWTVLQTVNFTRYGYGGGYYRSENIFLVSTTE